MLNQSTNAPELEEDTLELELTAEQTHSLANAAEALRLEAAAPAIVALPTPQPRVQQVEITRFRLWHLLLVAAVVGASAALTWRATAQRTPQRASVVQAARVVTPQFAAASTPLMPAAAAAAVSAPAASAPASASDAPLRMHNPFDRSEVFEFPAGTTRSDARAQIAQILYARAQDRRSQASGAAAAKRHATNN